MVVAVRMRTAKVYNKEQELIMILMNHKRTAHTEQTILRRAAASFLDHLDADSE